MAQDRFEADQYWEERLTRRYTLGSVGWAGLGDTFNCWMYRVRRWIFRRVVKEICGGAPSSSLRVLDIGSGTGFYIDSWHSLGVSQVTGTDLTTTAVRQLTARHPQTPVYQGDIGEQALEVPAAPFDAVTIMDVLYHIVDDDRYVAATKNLAKLVKPDGFVVLTENMVARRVSGKHQVSRSREEVEQALAAGGLVPVLERPMFWLMNAPVASDSRLLSEWWRALTRIVCRSEAAGWILGAALFPLELVLLSVMRRGPSSKIIVCKRQEPSASSAAGAVRS